MIKCIYIDGYNTIEDGSVLKNTEPKCFDEIASIIGCQKKDIDDHAEFFSMCFGNFVWEYHEIFWRSLVKKYNNSFDEELIEQVYDKFLDYYEKEVILFDGVLQALKELSSKVKLILVANANAKRLKRLIHKFNLNKYFFDYVISSETPYQKPNKFMFEYGLNMYDWKPEEVLMVGDKYDNDILGAKKSGLLTAILISKSKAPNNCKCIPDFMVDSIDQLNDIVQISQCKYYNRIDVSLGDSKSAGEQISAFIVAGGKGSRLGELGKNTQKCMLPLWGKPILYYTIVSLKNAGCSKILLAVNHLSEQVENYFGDGSNLGVEIEYIKEDTIGTYDAIYKSINKLNDRIIYAHANILFQNILLENLINIGNEKDKSVVSVIKSDLSSLKHAQVDIDDSNTVIAVDLNERNGKLPYTFLGVGYYKKDDILRLYNKNRSGMVEKVLQQLLEENKGNNALSYIYEGGWRHIETEQDYRKISEENRWDIYYEH